MSGRGPGDAGSSPSAASRDVLQKLDLVQALLNDIKGVPKRPKGFFGHVEDLLASKLALVVVVPIFTAVVVSLFSYRNAISAIELEDALKKAAWPHEDDRTRKLKEFEANLDRANQEALARLRKQFDDAGKKDDDERARKLKEFEAKLGLANQEALARLRSQLDDEMKKADAEREVARRRAEQTSRRAEIALEIDRRFTIYAPYVNGYLVPREGFRLRLPEEVKGTVKYLFSGKPDEYRSVSQKWREYSLAQLFSELSALKPEDEVLARAVSHIGEFSARVTVDSGGLALNLTGPMWVERFCSHWKTHQPHLADRVSTIRYDWGGDPQRIPDLCSEFAKEANKTQR